MSFVAGSKAGDFDHARIAGANWSVAATQDVALRLIGESDEVNGVQASTAIYLGAIVSTLAVLFVRLFDRYTHYEQRRTAGAVQAGAPAGLAGVDDAVAGAAPDLVRCAMHQREILIFVDGHAITERSDMVGDRLGCDPTGIRLSVGSDPGRLHVTLLRATNA